MNSLYQQLQQQPQTTMSSRQPQISDFFNEKGEFDLQKLINQNPQLKMILSLKNGNQSYKDLFFMIAQQRGIDPQNIINLLQKQPNT